MVTAVRTNSRFFEPTRRDISASAPSIGRPRRVSVSTRWNSLDAGSWPSSTTAWMPWRKLCPAFREAATVVRRSGSCASNAFRRRLARRFTQPYGMYAPSASAPRSRKNGGLNMAAMIPAPSAAAAMM